MVNKDTLHVAYVQCHLSQGQVQSNLNHIEELCSGLKQGQVDLLILPEMFNTGYMVNPGPLAEVHNQTTYKWLHMLAQRLGALVVGTYAVKQQEQLYNRLLACDNTGIVAQYDKRHLFTFAGEDAHFAAGNSHNQFEYKGWQIRPSICYDLRFPVWLRQQPHQPYDLLVCPANWPAARQSAWNLLLPARAVENAAYVIGVNRVGKDSDNNVDYSGGSAIIDHKGNYLSSAHSAEGIYSTTLDKSSLYDYRKKFPVLNDADQFSIKQ